MSIDQGRKADRVRRKVYKTGSVSVCIWALRLEYRVVS